MNEYDAIVVGAGPAGLTSAIYLARANKKTLVLESKIYGGQIVNASNIQNYPAIQSISGVEFANNLYNQVVSLGVEVKFETVLKVDENKTVTTKDNVYKAKAIILATGVDNKKLGIDNESLFVGKGVSYCATCDGNFFKKKTVAVVGGGNTALEDALYLSNLCEKVYLIHRIDEFRGEQSYKEELDKKDNVEYILNSTVKSLKGDTVLTGLDIIDNNGKIKSINVDGLFIAVGQSPKNEMFKNVVDLDEYGYFKNDLAPRTKTKGIYVAGDAVAKELRQLTTAVSDGSYAATIAIMEMKGE